MTLAALSTLTGAETSRGEGWRVARARPTSETLRGHLPKAPRRFWGAMDRFPAPIARGWEYWFIIYIYISWVL